MTRGTLLFLSLFSITYLSFSQYTWTNGEVILKNGDIIVGEIKIPMISKDFINFNGKSKVKVRSKLNGNKTVFDENQVKLVKFNYSGSEIAYYVYVPVSKNKKEIFCIVSTGSVTLYGRAVSMTSSGPGTMTMHNLNELYAQRIDEVIATPLKTARPSRSFRKRAIEYFNDCPSVVNKLERKEIKKMDQIIAMVDEYNNCL